MFGPLNIFPLLGFLQNDCWSPLVVARICSQWQFAFEKSAAITSPWLVHVKYPAYGNYPFGCWHVYSFKKYDVNMRYVTSSNSPGSPPPLSSHPPQTAWVPALPPGDRFALSACGAWPAQWDIATRRQWEKVGMWQVNTQYLDSWIFNWHVFFCSKHVLHLLLGCSL